MRDWKALARAHGLNVPPEELERTVAPLRDVEEIFRSLTADLTPDLEPAYDVRLEAGE